MTLQCELWGHEVESPCILGVNGSIESTSFNKELFYDLVLVLSFEAVI